MTDQSAVKTGLPSRNVTEGVHNALHRVFYFAMGLDEVDIHHPFIAVVTASDDSVDTFVDMQETARQVKAGVWRAQGTPREIRTISGATGLSRSGSDGQFSMLERELIADSAELAVRGHSYDGIVGVGATMSALAGLAMVAYRLDVPSIVIPLVGFTPAADCATKGAAALGLALEVIGLAPAGSVASAGDQSVQADWAEAGCEVMALVDDRAHVRPTMTPPLLSRALRVLAAVGAPPEAILHIQSIASEAGIAIDLLEVAPWLRETFVAALDVADALVLSESTTRILSGSLAPDGAIATSPRAAAASPVEGPAKVFESSHDAMVFVSSGAPTGEVLVVRGQGPRSGTGFPSLDALAEAVDALQPHDIAAVVTDGLLPRLARHVGVSVVGPEAVDGGPIANVADGDIVALDFETGRLDVQFTVSTRRPFVPELFDDQSPMIWKYTQVVGPARYGALTHEGARSESVAYRDL